MSEHVIESESNYGTSIILMSNSDMDSFPKNNPADFENVFKNPIKLSNLKEYEIVMANLHVPSYQNTLLKNDHDRSFVQYNLGVFTHNTETNKFELEENTSSVLWKYVPDTSFAGLAFENDLKNTLPHSSQMDLAGLGGIKTQKIRFMKRLTQSLKIHDEGDNNTQMKCLRGYSQFVYGEDYNYNTNPIFGEFDYFNGQLKFKDLSSLKHYERYKLIARLMRINMKPSPNFSTHMKEALHLESVDLLIKSSDNQPGERSELRSGLKEHFISMLNLYPRFNDYKVVKKRTQRSVEDDTIHHINKVKSVIGEDTIIMKKNPNKKTRKDTSNSPPNIFSIKPLKTESSDIENSDLSGTTPMDRDSFLKHYQKSIIGLYVSFGDRMRSFLNIEDEPVIITYTGFAIEDPSIQNQKIKPNFAKKPVKTIMVYSNLVKKSVRVGNHITNLLDICTYGPNINNRSNSLHVYKSLANTYLRGATVGLTDQHGNILSFPENTFTALEVVIKPRQ